MRMPHNTTTHEHHTWSPHTKVENHHHHSTGLLVPDIPLEETPEIREIAEANGLELVLLTTPTTPKERMNAIAQNSQGFVYLVSITGIGDARMDVDPTCLLVASIMLQHVSTHNTHTGVTGAKEDVSGRVEGLVADLHDVTDKPVAVGFGVSKPEHVKKIVDWGAEGVIVGSALVRALGEAATPVCDHHLDVMLHYEHVKFIVRILSHKQHRRRAWKACARWPSR